MSWAADSYMVSNVTGWQYAIRGAHRLFGDAVYSYRDTLGSLRVAGSSCGRRVAKETGDSLLGIVATMATVSLSPSQQGSMQTGQCASVRLRRARGPA
jgi:hypothetical protein